MHHFGEISELTMTLLSSDKVIKHIRKYIDAFIMCESCRTAKIAGIKKITVTLYIRRIFS